MGFFNILLDVLPLLCNLGMSKPVKYMRLQTSRIMAELLNYCFVTTGPCFKLQWVRHLEDGSVNYIEGIASVCVTFCS